MTKRKRDPQGMLGPQFIELADGRWALPELMTAAQWIEAREVGRMGDDEHSLLQFRLATMVLENAERNGLLHEGVCLMEALDRLPKPTSAKPDLRLTQSAA
jgi:hypothetical protein